MKILVATDKFKGSLTASQVCDSVKGALFDVDPQFEIHNIPLADGGEGSLEALSQSGDRVVECIVSDPLMRKVKSSYIVRQNGIAVIEMASSVGLARLLESEYNPEKTSSYGFGEMIVHAYHTQGVRKFILTIGGSATSDCGIGMLSAMGLTFQDANGVDLPPIGGSLCEISKISYSKAFGLIRQCNFTVATDVDNPLLGKNGAAHFYAPQKGADSSMVERLEQGGVSFVNLINKDRCEDVGSILGGGAAGGVGMALRIFLSAKMLSGADFIIEYRDVEKFIEWCDVVITGEGKVDRQTLNGKLVWRIISLAKKHNKRCVVICGALQEGINNKTLGVDAIYSLVREGVTSEMAIADAERYIHDVILKNFI
ncbi:MAG: glycerate kinase [Rikenellaceae bacterium]